MFTEQLPDLHDYVNDLPGFACLVGYMNIHIETPLQSLTKQTLITLGLYSHLQAINEPTHRCGHIIDYAIVRLEDDIHMKSTVTDSLESHNYCTKSCELHFVIFTLCIYPFHVYKYNVISITHQ